MVMALSSGAYPFMIRENVWIYIQFYSLLESAFVKLPRFWHELIVNPACRTVRTVTYHKFAQKGLFPICNKRLF